MEELYRRSKIVLIDNRPMFTQGIKSSIKTIDSSLDVFEYKSIEEIINDKLEWEFFTFFLRVGNTYDHVILSNIRKLRNTYGSCKIILYDYQESIDYIITLFKENIDAYLPDNFDEGDLKECFLSVESNKLYLNTQIALQLLTFKPNKRTERKIQFTPTEVKVARLLVRGMRTSLIAKEMGKKISTISTIKSNIFKKAKVSNIIDLASSMDNMQIA
ncbi:hypothetical protein DSL64_06110 [Dyadobacter luteus]|jgi:DNA-binding NarL/FixJ family response regulator|uniref:HTH luxR-type domain-containing protein n=1 Tax=Dyadobacter luteus TaxID=2259619 RepID=A0A3D8YF11_9BACT|nr:response regulator transcription factor [Dyadobacter luteus]REA63186.1 hypothetical protein DSL64_06110 [Dyadobacter luteus]